MSLQLFETSPFKFNISKNVAHISMHSLPGKRKARVTCNFNFGIETGGLLRVTGSYVHHRRRHDKGGISQTVEDSVVITAVYTHCQEAMTYRMASFELIFDDTERLKASK